MLRFTRLPAGIRSAASILPSDMNLRRTSFCSASRAGFPRVGLRIRFERGDDGVAGTNPGEYRLTRNERQNIFQALSLGFDSEKLLFVKFSAILDHSAYSYDLLLQLIEFRIA